MRQIVYPFRLALGLLALTAASGAGAAYAVNLSRGSDSAALYDYGGAAAAVLLATLLLVVAVAQRRGHPSVGFAPLIVFRIVAILAALGTAGFGVLLFLISPFAMLCDAGQTCIDTLNHLWLGAGLYLLTALLFVAVFVVVLSHRPA